MKSIEQYTEIELTAPKWDNEGNLGNVWLIVRIFPRYVELRQYDGVKSRRVTLSAKELHKLFKGLLMEKMQWVEHD